MFFFLLYVCLKVVHNCFHRPVIFSCFCFIIIIMEVCIKFLNKHSVTHIMYIKMEMLSAIKMYLKKEEDKYSSVKILIIIYYFYFCCCYYYDCHQFHFFSSSFYFLFS